MNYAPQAYLTTTAFDISNFTITIYGEGSLLSTVEKIEQEGLNITLKQNRSRIQRQNVRNQALIIEIEMVLLDLD